MSITFQWYDDEKTIMLQRYVPPWTWEEYLDVAAETLDEIATVNHQVISIADFTPTDMLPIASGLIKVAINGIKGHPPNWHGVVLVTNKRMVQTMAKLFQGSTYYLDYEVYIENTFEDALNRVEKIRAET